jgi:hypothetical protein
MFEARIQEIAEIRALTDTQMEGVMRGGLSSTLKSIGLYALETGQVARPQTAMRDVPLKRAVKVQREVR